MDKTEERENQTDTHNEHGLFPSGESKPNPQSIKSRIKLFEILSGSHVSGRDWWRGGGDSYQRSWVGGRDQQVAGVRVTSQRPRLELRIHIYFTRKISTLTGGKRRKKEEKKKKRQPEEKSIHSDSVVKIRKFLSWTPQNNESK